MQYSGILIAVRAEDAEDLRLAVDALAGFEVHSVHPEEGRMIAVQEAADTESCRSGLQQVQGLPGVLFAELVYHLVDDGNGSAPPSTTTTRGERP